MLLTAPTSRATSDGPGVEHSNSSVHVSENCPVGFVIIQLVYFLQRCHGPASE